MALVGIAWFLLSSSQALLQGNLRGIPTVLLIYAILLVGSHFAPVFTLTWVQLAWIVGSAAAGVLLGASVSLVIGFGRLGLPRELETTITEVQMLLPTAATASKGLGADGALKELARLDKAAHSLIGGASLVRTRLSFFRQGMGSAAWERLQMIQSELEVRVANFTQFAGQQIAEANTLELVQLWKTKSEYSRQAMQLVNDAINGLAARMTHYRSLTALIIAATALAVSMLGVVLRLAPPPATP